MKSRSKEISNDEFPAVPTPHRIHTVLTAEEEEEGDDDEVEDAAEEEDTAEED